MGLFDDVAVPELDEDLRLIRDRRGRLALSRPSVRQRFPVRSLKHVTWHTLPQAQGNGTPDSTSTTTAGKAGSGIVANSAKVLSPRPFEGTPESSVSEKTMEPVQPRWSSAEDARLLALQREGKSWDYIEGKLDDKGKSMSALKTRFDELLMEEEGAPEDKEERTGQKEEKPAKSPGKRSKSKKGKEKEEGFGSGSDKGSSKSDKESSGSSDTLLDSSKTAEYEASDEGNASKKDKDATIVPKEGYVGKHGRGEVRFFNDVAILYKHSGTNAEQLDTETVAILHKEATKHDHSKWLTVVSRLFDKTGIRMDPEVARIALEKL